jgi:ribonuclease-3
MIYELVKTEGPPHRPLHWVRILLNGEVIGQGQGRSIKEAKKKAAEDALKNMQPLA